MSKIVLFLLVGLLVADIMVGQAAVKSSRCGRHGDSCVADSDCCPSIKCHRYANRCQVQITAEELMAQREKILGRRGPDQ